MIHLIVSCLCQYNVRSQVAARFVRVCCWHWALMLCVGFEVSLSGAFKSCIFRVFYTKFQASRDDQCFFWSRGCVARLDFKMRSLSYLPRWSNPDSPASPLHADLEFHQQVLTPCKERSKTTSPVTDSCLMGLVANVRLPMAWGT